MIFGLSTFDSTPRMNGERRHCARHRQRVAQHLPAQPQQRAGHLDDGECAGTASTAAVPTAFFVVKVAGALYLLWLGWQMLRHPLPVAGAANAQMLRSPFMRGVLSNVLNPKIAICFGAIRPQFIAPERGQRRSAGVAAAAWCRSPRALRST